MELALAALQGDDGRQTWALYHLIGDVLRFEPGPPLSAGFAGKMATRLAAEPLPGKKVVSAEPASVAGVAAVPVASA